jgi:hypothetical protein
MAKKNVKAKNVSHTKGKENVTKEVSVSVTESDPEPTPKPAIQAEPTMKTVGKGGFVELLTKSEYDKKYGKKKAKK